MFKAERKFDMTPFGWPDCKFTFNALTWGEQRELDRERIKWQSSTDDKTVEEAANKIVDFLKAKFVSGQAINDKNEKVDVTTEDFENIPFDILLKLIAWVTSGEVDEAFLVK